MGDVEKGIDAVLRRKKAIGLFLLAIGCLLYVGQVSIEKTPPNLELPAFMLIIAGIILLTVKLSRRKAS